MAREQAVRRDNSHAETSPLQAEKSAVQAEKSALPAEKSAVQVDLQK
ncbi:MAG: hypothetical protein ACRDPS_17450 [Nocardioides sp.]